MEWKSVTDKPKESGEYLCCFTGWDDMVCKRTLDYDMPFDEWSDWSGDVYLEVTHWQELPEDPK